MIEQAIGLDASQSLAVSAKTGEGVPEILEAIVKRLPPPRGSPNAHLQALIFDSWFDPYRGVIVLTRIFQGTLTRGQKIRLWSNGRTFEIETLGVLTPKPVDIDALSAGQIGLIIANIKRVAETQIVDTITDVPDRAIQPLAGFQDVSSI